jgi:hypothetical protein
MNSRMIIFPFLLILWFICCSTNAQFGGGMMGGPGGMMMGGRGMMGKLDT